MKLQAIGALIAAPLFLAGPLVQSGGEDEVRALVDLQGQQIAELRADLTETQSLLNRTLEHLKAQGSAAKAMQSTLSKVESLGFLAGINSNSRVALLSGLREYLGEQQGAPNAVSKPAKTAKATQDKPKSL